VAPLAVEGPPVAPEVMRVEGAPLEGEEAVGSDETPPQVPVGIERVDGRLLAWTADGAWMRGQAQDWKALPWGGARDEVAPRGLRFAVARGSGGAWLVADNGLYQVVSEAVVRSPLSDGVEAAGLVTLDSLGEGAGEELWLNGSSGVAWVTGGESRPVSLRFDTLGRLSPPSAVVAVSAGRALWVTGGRAFLVDVAGGRATWLGDGLGEVQAFARDLEGQAWLATTRGLYAFDAASERIKGYTLAAPGAQPANVRDVTASGARVLASAGGKVLQREGDTFRSFGTGTVGAHGVRVDGEGRTWVLEVERLRALQTAPPVSFEASVRPLLQQRCQGCHADGGGNSPVLALSDYATAKALSGRISARITATNSSPMPPVSAGTLPAEEVGTVMRWISGGMAP
jgi:ligand-binding sensor domain-containing protein